MFALWIYLVYLTLGALPNSPVFGSALVQSAGSNNNNCQSPREALSNSWNGLSVEKRAKMAPVVFHGLAVETYPPIDSNPPSNGFYYSAQFWLISVYKSAKELSHYFHSGPPVDGVYDIRDRRVNVTGFYRPNASESPKCWIPVTSQKYYVIFAELIDGVLTAKEDRRRGATADWTEQNEGRVWRGVGWDEWSDWSACSTSCGDGTQHRWRYCLQQSGCQGFNKQTRKCNSFSCNGVVAPLTLEDKRYFHPSQWERVPGRDSAWRLKPNSYLWLPAAELPFPANYFKNHFALLLSLRIDPKKQAGGTLFSLRSRRQEECYFAVEVAGQDAIKLVHSGPNGTQSVLIPALISDGKWHRLALGIQDDSSVRSYFDCRWVSTDILKKNSLDIPEDADLVIGYLFAGELEDMILVGDPSGVAQQCSTNLTPSLDPLLEAARPHKRPHKMKQHASKQWLPPALQTNRIFSDDEDFEGSGYSSINSELEWSDWSECNATCGPGVQHRTSLCSDPDCQPERVTRPCVASTVCPLQKSKDKCSCMNGGLCKKRTGECKCKSGWEGETCEEPSCRPRCRNGGKCLRPGVCQCSKHYTGSICQTPICDPPCHNGGHCVGNNQCLCPLNTNGDHCQNFTCGEGCKNGGICVGPGLCECPHNSTGEHCQEPVCDPPCENGATCAPGNTCLCQPYSSGPRCHEKKCEYRPVQEPYVRGYRRLLLKKHFESKCDPRDWKSCVKSVPEYQNVYERAYRTSYKCVDQP